MSSPDPQRRAFWLKHLHQWHWVSSAACLIGMLLFAATGVTLNHASDIPTTPVVTNATGQLPEALRTQLARETRTETETAAASGGKAKAKAVAPPALAAWTAANLKVRIEGRDAEWNEPEIYVSLPVAGGDAWLTADLETGAVRYERTDRGWVAYLNDLHKGRNTGVAWKWFLDIFAVACVVFTITGLFLLQLHGGNRPATWPMVGLGLVIPLLLAMLFIH